jgi:hypothetical protein
MNPKQQSVIIGAVAGAAIGAVAGFLFTRGLELPREEEESRGLSLRRIPPGAVVSLFIAVMGVLRGVAELGETLEVD